MLKRLMLKQYLTFLFINCGLCNNPQRVGCKANKCLLDCSPCEIAMSILGNEGACKINGGGFAGSIICAVPKHLV